MVRAAGLGVDLVHTGTGASFRIVNVLADGIPCVVVPDRGFMIVAYGGQRSATRADVTDEGAVRHQVLPLDSCSKTTSSFASKVFLASSFQLSETQEAMC